MELNSMMCRSSVQPCVQERSWQHLALGASVPGVARVGWHEVGLGRAGQRASERQGGLPRASRTERAEAAQDESGKLDPAQQRGSRSRPDGQREPEVGPQAGRPQEPEAGPERSSPSFNLLFYISFDPWLLFLIREVRRARRFENFAIPGVIPRHKFN
jgi:hypothetical protein